MGASIVTCQLLGPGGPAQKKARHSEGQEGRAFVRFIQEKEAPAIQGK